MKTPHYTSGLFAVFFLTTTLGFSQVAAPSPAAVPAAPPSATPAKEDPAVPVPRLNMVGKDGRPYMMVRHLAYVERVKRSPCPEIVFFGDSITEWWFDWQNHYGKYGAVNFGIGGDKVQNLLWRIYNGEMEMKPKVAVVLIGTNNINDNPDRIAAGIIKVVEAIQEKSPDTKILLLGIFPRGWDANEYRWYAPRIARVNAIIAKLDDGTKVRFLDIGDKLLEPDGTISRAVLKDGLHPSGRGYLRWGAAMQPLLEEMVGKPMPYDAPILPPLPAAKAAK